MPGLRTEAEVVAEELSRGQGVAFIASGVTMASPHQPLLCVDLTQPERAFRVVPEAVWITSANLSLADMDFEEVLYALDGDGIFRGFQAQ